MSTLSKTERQQLIAQKLFQKRKNKSKTVQEGDEVNSKNDDAVAGTSKSNSKEIEERLTKQAIAEIQRDTKRASELAEQVGACGWHLKSSHKTNKRFLANTMRSVINHNKRTTVKHAVGSKQKLDEVNKRPSKFGNRLHSFQNREERLTKREK